MLRWSSRSTATLALTTSSARACRSAPQGAICRRMPHQSRCVTSVHAPSCTCERHAPKPRSVRRTFGSSGPRGCHPQLQDPGGQSPTDPMTATPSRRLQLTQKVDNKTSTLKRLPRGCHHGTGLWTRERRHEFHVAKLTLVNGGIKPFVRSLDTARSTTDAGHPADSKAKRSANPRQGSVSIS